MGAGAGAPMEENMFRLLAMIDAWVPLRYLTWLVFGVAGIAGLVMMVMGGGAAWWAVAAVGLAGALQGCLDVRQTKRSILRNYPVIGHMRFIFESVRPELRQYFLESDNEATPFSRQQRSLVYQRAKGDSDKRPFGTQLDVHAEGYEWINHSLRPSVVHNHDFRVQIGAGGSSCTRPYSASIFNISAMSFGALSANAIRALNGGARKGNFAHDTGEGSISVHHRANGGDLIWEIGSGYFGCRHDDGTFSEERFVENARDPQVKMIEIKLSQGAKPGHGGVLPGPKVTPEIAQARGVPMGVDCVSPASHSAFTTPRELMHFIERLRTLSGGKPVGFKLCIGHPWEWFGICKAMLETGITPDFIVVDGAEGGTGAAPLEFADHMGTPVQEGLLLVHNTLVGVGLRQQIKLGSAGKVVSAYDIARMMALGADWCNAARGFMFALGCIQSQSCHTGACPTGVATQDPDRQKALVVADKTERVWRFHQHTLEALQELVQAAGLTHPGQISASHIVRRSGQSVTLLSTTLPFVTEGSILAAEKGAVEWPFDVFRTFWPRASADTFDLKMDLKRAVAVGRQGRSVPRPVFMMQTADASGERSTRH